MIRTGQTKVATKVATKLHRMMITGCYFSNDLVSEYKIQYKSPYKLVG